MANPTATDCMAEAASLLNDTGRTIFTDAVLLPYFKKVYNEVQEEFELHSLPISKEVSAATTVEIAALTITVPDDLVFPLKLEERVFGGTDEDYISMQETDWTPSIAQTDKLRYWNWREGVIYTPGATTKRSVMIYYVKSLVAITTGAGVIAERVMQTTLAAGVAALAAILIGGAKDKGEFLLGNYQLSKNRLIAIATRSMQGLPIRRRPYGVRMR